MSFMDPILVEQLADSQHCEFHLLEGLHVGVLSYSTPLNGIPEARAK